VLCCGQQPTSEIETVQCECSDVIWGSLESGMPDLSDCYLLICESGSMSVIDSITMSAPTPE
jgi:hypothetical protein